MKEGQSIFMTYRVPLEGLNQLKQLEWKKTNNMDQVFKR